MWAQLIALALFVLLLTVIVIVFARDIIVVTTNVAILYFVWLKFYTDVVKKNRVKEYLWAGIAGVLITILVGKYIPLWWVTQFAAFTVVTAAVFGKQLRNLIRK